MSAPRSTGAPARAATAAAADPAAGTVPDGREVRLSGGEVGLRRAEFEGQLPRLVDDPSLLVLLADTYAEHHPGGPELVEVQIVQRRFELVDGEATGAWTDRVLVEQELEAGP